MSPGKWAQLKKRLHDLSIIETEIKETFVRGSGKGGQKVNKTSHCVVLVYDKYNLALRCEKDRSREVNRYLAKQLLCDKVELLLTGTNAKTKETQKKKKQKERRKRRQKLEKK